MPNFLSATLIRGGSVDDLQEGQIFIPTQPGEDYFVTGRVGETRMLLCLSEKGEFRFAGPEEWSRSDGVIVNDVQIEPDLETATEPFSAMDRLGTLVFAGDAVAIMGSFRHHRRAVAVRGVMPEAGTVIGFRGWRIVTGSGDQKKVLFQRTPSAGPSIVELMGPSA